MEWAGLVQATKNLAEKSPSRGQVLCFGPKTLKA